MLEILLSFGWLKDVARLVMSGFVDRSLAASHTTVCYYEGKVYVYGGLAPSIVSTSSFHCYDIATNTWTTLATNSSLRRSAGMVAHNGYIYLYGGSNHAAAAYFSTVVRYHIATNTWTTTGFTAGIARSDFAYQLFGDRFYVFGGYNGGLLDYVNYYNIPTNTWVTVQGRSNFRFTGACTDGTYIYLAGGQTSGILGQFVRYNPANDTYLVLADLPWTTHSAILISVGDKIYYSSGYNDGAYGAKAAEYVPATNTWTEIEIDNPSINGLAGHAQADGVAWSVGGYNGSARTGWIRKHEPIVP